MAQSIKRALQDPGGGHLVDEFAPTGAADVALVDQDPFDRRGGEALVPEGDRQVTKAQQIAREGPCRLATAALGAVHVHRQADHHSARLSLGGQDEQTLGVRRETAAADERQRRGDSARTIGHRHADGTLAEVETEQNRRRPQRLGHVDKRDHRHRSARAAKRDACQTGEGAGNPLTDPYSAFRKTTMAIDADTVRKVAGLARIRVEDARLAPLAAELSGILAWIEQLAEVDTADVQPMTSAVAVALPMRQDVVTDGGDAAVVLANGPRTEKGFFVVPKVVE